MGVKFSDLEYLVRPRRIAILGASDKAGYGLTTIQNLERIGYQGEICPVNPKYDVVAGYKCYPSLSDIPGDVDAVVIAVQAKYVLASVEEAIKKGVRNGVVYASSFAEVGEEGKKAQQQLVELAEQGGLNLIGPNCLGIINLQDRVCMWGLTMGGNINPGRTGLVSQSGNIAINLMQSGRGIGFSVVLSLGNQAVLDVADYINLLVNDPNTDVITAVIEFLKDTPKFISAVENAARAGKPVVVLKSGRSEKGQMSSFAHTGALAGMDDLYDSLFKKYGVTRVYDFDQFIETAKALSIKKRPMGTGFSMVSYSGGECILGSDLAEDYGLSLAELTDDTKAAIRSVLPDFATVNNPLDVTASMWSELDRYSECLRRLLADPGVDLLAVVHDTPVDVLDNRRFKYTQILETCVKVAETAEKPVVNLSTIASQHTEARDILMDGGVVPLHGAYHGLLAIKHLMNYSQFLNTLPARTEPHERVKVDKERVSAIFKRSKDRVISELDSKEILKAYGIPVPEGRVVSSEEEAVDLARQIGYPLVLKVQAASVHHKTDAGGVILNVRNEEQLRFGYRSIHSSVTAHCPGVTIEGILVERMAEVAGCVEVIVGAKRDPQVGPFILFGLGGIFVEVLKDCSTKMVPINKWDAEEMIGEIKGKALLQGARGRKKSDTSAIVDVLLRVSDFVEDFGEQLAELDINPLVVMEDGKGCMALDAMIVKSA